MTTHTCKDCGADVPTGLATVRTTLDRGELVSVAWCRVCRPLPTPTVPLIPAQRVPEREKVEP